MDQPPVLDVCELTVDREGHRVISDVSLAVAPGSVHLLVGPNGAGKSTLLSAVLGLVEFAGSIRFHWRKAGRIGYVPQSFKVDRTLPLTVGEFLALPRQRRPVCFGTSRAQRKLNEQLLEQVRLPGYASRPLGALSGGELQRVLLANAIDPTPELLLLDEPASGLDESAARQFEILLLELRRSSGTSVLMVSHDLAQVRRLADEVTLLDRKVSHTGPPAEVLAGGPVGSFTLGSECPAP